MTASKKRKVLGSLSRFRLVLTLGVAVLLPAVGLIYVNFHQLQTFKRDKVLEAAIHRDFQELLAITEKRMNKKLYAMVEDVREMYPSPDLDQLDKEVKLDRILQKNKWLSDVLFFDEEGLIIHSQRNKMEEKYYHEQNERMANSYRIWFKGEGHGMLEEMRKRNRPTVYSGMAKRPYGDSFVATVIFDLPKIEKDRVVIAGFVLDDVYLKKTFFPDALKEALSEKVSDQSGSRIAMTIFPTNDEGGMQGKPIAVTEGWDEGKPEVTRKFEFFRPLALGIRFQGTSVKELQEMSVHQSFVILGILSLMTIGGLLLTKHMVSKEMAVAKLKSDFVSNVSHELRTPLALIRLYAETLELGRITTSDKKQQYYRIIRKESERLTSLINNILDFSRIEAGRKEYEFRETDIAELVRNTLDSYRYQIEQQGFALEENIQPNLPILQVDREAIARALVNLINNALKYSNEDKFLGVKLYRENGVVKLEVSDHGIGISRHDQSKIFEKFYRAGDPLVHNTKGSGLGLSLVRHISEAHGGDIAVESTPGKGSKFVLSLPVKTVVETVPHQVAEGSVAL
jgi:signal transduction histidine kinase